MPRKNPDITRVQDDVAIRKQEKGYADFCTALAKLHQQSDEAKTKAAEAEATFDEVSALVQAGEKTEADVKRARKAAEDEVKRALELESVLMNRRRASEIMRSRLEASRAQVQERIDREFRDVYALKVYATAEAGIKFERLNADLKKFAMRLEDQANFKSPVQHVAYPHLSNGSFAEWLASHRDSGTDVPDLSDKEIDGFNGRKTLSSNRAGV